MSHETLPTDQPVLNFADQLWTNFDTAVAACDNGYKSLNEFTNFLKERIRVERAHCKNLAKISQKLSGKFELGTLATAINRLKIDTAQSSNERIAFASILETDVFEEVAEMKSLYEKMNGKLVQEGRKISKALTEAREKAYSKSDSDIESSGRFSGLSTLFKPKEANRHHSEAMDPKSRLKAVESLYTDVMVGVFEGIQSNEEARIRCLRAALRKYIVFETSFIANRSYDMRDMAEIMEKIDHVEVIQQIIMSARANTPGTDTPHELVPLGDKPELTAVEPIAHDDQPQGDLEPAKSAASDNEHSLQDTSSMQ